MKKNILLLVLMLGICFMVNAQPGNTGGFGDEPNDAPLDGGVLLLASVGVAYGYKKLKKKH